MKPSSSITRACLPRKVTWFALLCSTKIRPLKTVFAIRKASPVSKLTCCTEDFMGECVVAVDDYIDLPVKQQIQVG